MKILYSLIIFFIFFSGCSKENETQQQEVAAYNEEIPVVDEVWIKNKIENRNGKILFVNFWATWCVPCVEEFPDLVKIYNEHKSSDFEFLSNISRADGFVGFLGHLRSNFIKDGFFGKIALAVLF